jgi:putative intracellular protease/amidase
MLHNNRLIPSAILVVLFVSSLPALSTAVSRSAYDPDGYRRQLTYNRDGNNAGAAQTQTQQRPPTVAILLFDGVQIIDYSGPWEVFGQAGFEVHTVAEKTEPVTTRFGQKVIADYTFDNSPKADILLLPGGRGTLKAADNPRVIKWIQANAKDARYVMSVCTGAFLLARAGLLDGLTATTFHGAIGALSEAAPKAKVVYDQRYVDNGKVITTAGLSSGIDGALHLVAKILGRGEAQSEALGLEYTWESDSKHARAAFADRYLPDFQGFDAKLISVEGDLEHWEMQVLVSKPASVAEIMELTRKQIVSATPHTSSAVTATQRAPKATDRAELEWKFTDDLGRGWSGLSVVEPAPDEKGKFVVTLKLARSFKQ